MCSATKIYQMPYLHHQVSDGADILQFDSTNEYFETVKYELQTPFHVRVTPWFHQNFKTPSSVRYCAQELTGPRICRCRQLSANWSPLSRLRSTSVFFWRKSTLKYFNKKNTRASRWVSGHLPKKNPNFRDSFHWDSQPPSWIEWYSEISLKRGLFSWFPRLKKVPFLKNPLKKSPLRD